MGVGTPRSERTIVERKNLKMNATTTQPHNNSTTTTTTQQQQQQQDAKEKEKTMGIDAVLLLFYCCFNR